MSTAVQLRKGTTAEHATFTGAVAEVTVDTTKDTIVVHDGATAGGIPVAREDGSNATGTWGISVTGSAATAGSASTATNATNATNVTGTATSSVPTSALASGTANSNTFLRGDRTWALVGGTADVQTFNSSGTWTKPASGSMARIQVWGGGGGGGRGNTATRQTGGGGGGYNEITVPLSTLASSVSVTVGAGGAGRTGSTGVGSTGGTSSFGALVYAYGGGGGLGTTTNFTAATTGGGGGQISAGAAGVGGFNVSTVIGRPAMSGTNGKGMGIWSGGTGLFDTYSSVLMARPDALFGGGGGGVGSIANTQGSSVHGGDGGDRNQAGTAPGGGGGPSSVANGNGLDGAGGRVVVTVW
jgi:hypothetical protein